MKNIFNLRKSAGYMIIAAVLVLLATNVFGFVALGGLALGAKFAAAPLISGSKSYYGAQNSKIVFRPVFNADKMLQDYGVTITPTDNSVMTVNYFGAPKDVVMPYRSGFQGGATGAKYYKDVTLKEFKVELNYEEHTYADTVFQIELRIAGYDKNGNGNNISGSIVEQAELSLLQEAIIDDIWKKFWLSDATKVHINAGYYADGATTYAVGDPDVRYCNFVANTPASGLNGIVKTMNNDVAQNYCTKLSMITGWNKTTYPTLYMSADAGNGISYAYPTSATRISAQSGDRLFSITDPLTTYPQLVSVSVLNTSGFGGSIQIEKQMGATFEIQSNWDTYIPYVDMVTTLGTDTVELLMEKMVRIANPNLQKLVNKKDPNLRWYIYGYDLWENYQDTLRDANLESSRSAKVNGIDVTAYRGIPMIDLGLDAYIQADFNPTLIGKYWIMLTDQRNLNWWINAKDEWAKTRLWYNVDYNENRLRTQFRMGFAYALPEMAVICK